MPIYSFRDTKTGKEFTESMKIAELDAYLEANPNVEQVITVPNIVDSVGIGITRPPVDFQKHVLGRVKAKTPGATEVGNKRWDIPKEI